MSVPQVTITVSDSMAWSFKSLKIITDITMLVKVCVHRYPNGNLAIFHGHRKLASYNPTGKEVAISDKKAA